MPPYKTFPTSRSSAQLANHFVGDKLLSTPVVDHQRTQPSPFCACVMEDTLSKPLISSEGLGAIITLWVIRNRLPHHHQLRSYEYQTHPPTLATLAQTQPPQHPLHPPGQSKLPNE